MKLWKKRPHKHRALVKRHNEMETFCRDSTPPSTYTCTKWKHNTSLSAIKRQWHSEELSQIVLRKYKLRKTGGSARKDRRQATAEVHLLYQRTGNVGRLLSSCPFRFPAGQNLFGCPKHQQFVFANCMTTPMAQGGCTRNCKVGGSKLCCPMSNSPWARHPTLWLLPGQPLVLHTTVWDGRSTEMWGQPRAPFGRSWEGSESQSVQAPLQHPSQYTQLQLLHWSLKADKAILYIDYAKNW